MEGHVVSKDKYPATLLAILEKTKEFQKTLVS